MGRLTQLMAITSLCLLGACKRQHYPLERAEEVPYPTCPDGSHTQREIVADRALRSGRADTRQPIYERFRIEKRGCLWAVVVRQEWAVQLADAEVIYDDTLVPVRAWRRLTLPATKRSDGNADIKRFEMRLPDVTIKHRDQDKPIALEALRGSGKPRAVIGPGRGLLSMWLRRAKLAPGDKVKEPVLDFRGVERIDDTSLVRRPDQHVPELGRTVRVYTFLGRETVFADEDDIVVGDLAGLVPLDRSSAPPPPEMPTYGGADPVNTP